MNKTDDMLNKHNRSVLLKITTILLITILLVSIFIQISYARYVIPKSLSSSISSKPFYFNATSNATSIELQNGEANTTITVANNDGTAYNTYNTNYEVSLVGNNKFSFTVNNQAPTDGVFTNTINGASLINDNLNIGLAVKTGEVTDAVENVSILVESTAPYAKEVTIPITITEFYNVIFTGFSDFTPTEDQQLAVKNQTYSINLGSVIGTKALIIEMGGARISTYTYDETTGILSIPNVTGNIEITAVEVANIDFIVENENSTELTTPQVTATTTVSDYVDMTFNGINISNKKVTAISVTLTYTNTTGSKQTINCDLTHNGNTYHSNPATIQFKGNVTNATITYTFSGLNIQEGELFTMTNTVNKLTNKSIKITNETIHLTLT